MAIPPIASIPGGASAERIFGKTRLISLLALLGILISALVYSFMTRDVTANLSFLRNRNSKKTLVDLTPWQTAQALAPLAVTVEENEYARDAERLADHEVDQAFAAALRQSSLDDQHRVLTGDALTLAKKVSQFQQLAKQDQAVVDSLTAKTAPAHAGKKDNADSASDDGDLDVAKAQLNLDLNELSDAQRDLARASGDQSDQIQQELTAHEAAMKQYDAALANGDGQVAVVSARKHGTLSARVAAWLSQNDRHESIVQAQQRAQADVRSLTAQHDALEAKEDASPQASAGDHDARLANLKDRSAERQILSIYDDRIQTEQQLATVYGKWANQVQVQHRILLHLILQSVELILFILICMVIGDVVVRRFMANPVLDGRQMRTLRSVLELGIQVVGLVLILLVVFGTPQETPTILGLGTAALTIALQDFIIAFLGWFVLVGRNGIHVGDWVEINGVGGEVIEVHLFSTTLLETGTLADKGHPTGRRISFLNGFAIRGQYFNFTTSGQWMWDEIEVSLPDTQDVHIMVERIHEAVLRETEANARIAEQEWKRGSRGIDLSRFSAAPVENLRPSGSGIQVQVRYVTRASERFDTRNRLYQTLVDLLREPVASARIEEPQAVGHD
ncbi:MAG TPA: mechanosensitive ion channel domain-containing protein [Terracidiphilus sp.]|nr:mechanosensitive ion channel domain-containing protein [Terracidiphilus sp.]